MTDPRLLVFVSHDIWVRQTFASGAVDEILGPSTYVIASSGKTRDAQSLELLRSRDNFLGTVEDPRPVVDRKARGGEKSRFMRSLDYRLLEGVLTLRLRHRSNSIARRAEWSYTRRQRRLFRVAALPGLWHLLRWIVMRRTGLHSEIRAYVEKLKPDLIVAITGGYDSLSRDAFRCARALGVPSLGVVPNWDALSDKAGFVVRPDYIGVWGAQSAEQAERIHDFQPGQVEVLGAPGFEPYFRHVPGSRPSPFPFKYALFAGATRAFDELTPLEHLEHAIAERGLGLKVVYRPHPYRGVRKRPDLVREECFEHVVVDPQMHEIYLRHFEAYKPGGSNTKLPLPALDYYPALLDNAEFMICPLSTMTLEAALLEKRVLVPAYHDGLHEFSPGLLMELEHFRGLDAVEGIDFCDSVESLVERFIELASDSQPPEHSMREAVRFYVHFDGGSYGQRLNALVERIMKAEQRGQTVARTCTHN